MRHRHDAAGQLLFDLQNSSASAAPAGKQKPDVLFVVWSMPSKDDSVVLAAASWRAKRTPATSISVESFATAAETLRTIEAASDSRAYLLVDFEHRSEVDEEIAKLSKLMPQLSVIIFAEEPSKIQQDKTLEQALKGFVNLAKLRKRPVTDFPGEQGSKPFQWVAAALRRYC